MRQLFIFILLIIIPQVSSLTFDLNESQEIIIKDSQVEIKVFGDIQINNITSEIFDIDIKKNNIFDINFDLNEKNITQFNYSIEAIIPLSYYNTFKNSGESFLEYTTNFDIQTHRNVKLTKFDRDNNLTYSSRDITIEIINPTDYKQIFHINLIKTRPNQVNEFRNQLYLKTLYEIELDSNEKQIYLYKDLLSEIGDSYFVDYSIETLPKLNRKIIRNEIFDDSKNIGSSGSGIFNLLFKDLVIHKKISPETFSRNEIFTITFTISNPNSISANNVRIKDIIPKDFIFIENKELKSYLSIENFLPFETKEINYTLMYIGEKLDILLIPGTEIFFQERVYYTNSIILYPKTEQPKILIEKILTPIDNVSIAVEIHITNIGNNTINSFNLKDGRNFFYIPNLKSKEKFIIKYETKEIDYSLPKGIDGVNITGSIIINDDISIYHDTKSKTPPYSILLISLAAILLISDIIF